MDVLRRASPSTSLGRIVIAIILAGVVVADSAWLRSGNAPAPGGVFAAAFAFGGLLVAFTMAIVPRRAWTHAVVLASVLIGWPLAWGSALVATSGCGGTVPGSSNPLTDVLSFTFFLGPFFALFVPIWTPIPFAAAIVVDVAAIGFQRAVPRPLRWWVVVLAIASILVVVEGGTRYLVANGAHPTQTPCMTM